MGTKPLYVGVELWVFRPFKPPFVLNMSKPSLYITARVPVCCLGSMVILPA